MAENIVKECAGRIQRAVLKTALLVIYIIGFGMTWILVRLFRPSLLRTGTAGNNSSWKKAEGYTSEMKDAFEES